MLDSGIDWMEPKDLSVEDAIGGVNPSSGNGISSGHEFEIAMFRKPGANVSFVDGSIGSFGNDVPGDVLEALLTRDGGEKIDRAKYDLIARKARERERQRSIWWFALAALVVSVVVLLVRPRRRELERLDTPGNAVPGH